MRRFLICMLCGLRYDFRKHTDCPSCAAKRYEGEKL